MSSKIAAMSRKVLWCIVFLQRKLLSVFPLPSTQRQWKKYFLCDLCVLERSPVITGQAGERTQTEPIELIKQIKQ